MNILVTGGAGYIGSHTVRALQQAGYTPIIVSYSGSCAALSVFTYVVLTLSDRPSHAVRLTD